ncbi:MAG: hypothetical protein V7K88_29485 [Nostoc sp.]
MAQPLVEKGRAEVSRNSLTEGWATDRQACGIGYTPGSEVLQGIGL